MIDCINECVKTCHHKIFSHSLPTRLIYVGDRNGNKFGNPRLVTTTGPGASMNYFSTNFPKYAILSYCWGDSATSTLKTKQANLDDHLKGIQLEDMAPVCRDAVLVARAIGIEWLWIDALCILQDDREDWEQEASRMAEAYNNALLTIIPLRSHSSSETFLGQRESIDHVDISFKSVVNPTIEGAYTARNRLSTSSDVFDSYEFDLSASKWYSRGWTLQEATMSSRLLCFGESGIYFECNSMTQRDNGSLKPYCYNWTGDWIHEENLLEVWYRRMEAYSGRFLTFKKDILPAVSAIASIIANMTGDEYICGLWRSDLASGLIWNIAGTFRKLDYEEHMAQISSAEVYVGPSWSWTNPASNRTRAEWHLWRAAKIPTACDIIEAKSIVEGKNPFGCIQSAHILIRGQSRSLPGPNLYRKLYPNRMKQHWTAVEPGYFTAECELDWKVHEALEYIVENQQEEENNHKEEFPRRRVLTGASARWLHDLVMLLVRQDSEGETMSGLLLVRAQKENAWYRVGVFYDLSGECEGVDPLHNWETRTFKLV